MMCLGALGGREAPVHHSPEGFVGGINPAAYCSHPYSSASRAFRASGEMRFRAVMYLRIWWM